MKDLFAKDQLVSLIKSLDAIEFEKIVKGNNDWIINKEKMNLTNDAKFMHCLPIRRNIVASDEVLDNKNSLIIKQAENRIYSAQYVIEKLLKNE